MEWGHIKLLRVPLTKRNLKLTGSLWAPTGKGKGIIVRLLDDGTIEVMPLRNFVHGGKTWEEDLGAEERTFPSVADAIWHMPILARISFRATWGGP